MEKKRDPWRHVIVGASLSTLLFCPSTGYANGVFLMAFMRTGLYDAETVSWLVSVSNMMHAVGGPVASFLISLSSCRTAIIIAGLSAFLGFSLGSCTSDMRILFVTFGCILGVGRGIAFSTVSINIGYWFRENSNMASGLTFIGVGIGMLVHPRLVQAFVDWYGVNGAQMMMGAISFHTCICGLLLRPSVYELEKKRSVATDKLERRGESCKMSCFKSFIHFKRAILTNYPFLLIALGVCFFSMGFSIILTFMPDFFNFNGATPQESALAVSLSGMGSLVARILVGVMTNDPGIGSVLVLAGNCGLSAVVTLLLPFMVHSTEGRYLYSICIGAYLTSIFVILGPVTLEKVGLENLAYGFGFILLSTGIMNLIGPPVAVQVRKLTDSYYAAFVFAAGLLLATSVCVFLSEVVKDIDFEKNNPKRGPLLSASLVIDEPCGLSTVGEAATDSLLNQTVTLNDGEHFKETNV
ncbi:monocarboxylate transporter 12-like [Haliotis rubra]|uniref:monocarboxylate transporter 12-like n=1 Tax=Haliotis rubra TaxID=36100 RepID=UPI001EE60542|nr:monocarboxylate transporter 12-like [Haliotis rubra]XP_046545590.1 monocarboxylate transporter 12-like [Haliotis rubra]